MFAVDKLNGFGHTFVFVSLMRGIGSFSSESLCPDASNLAARFVCHTTAQAVVSLLSLALLWWIKRSSDHPPRGLKNVLVDVALGRSQRLSRLNVCYPKCSSNALLPFALSS